MRWFLVLFELVSEEQPKERLAVLNGWRNISLAVLLIVEFVHVPSFLRPEKIIVLGLKFRF